MKVCLIGMLIMISIWATAQVDSSTSNYIYKQSFQNHLAQLKVIDFPTITGKAESNIRICTPSKSQLLNPPLVVVKSHGEIFTISDSGYAKMSTIQPIWVKAMNILKGDQALINYREVGKNGVIEITIDDEKYPDAFKSIQKSDIKK